MSWQLGFVFVLLMLVAVLVALRDLPRPASVRHPIAIVAQPCSGARDSRFETACRDVMQLVFGMPFPKCRPTWLRNPLTNRSLELDGYDGKSVAFEADGQQHFVYPNRFHRTYADFLYQIKKDKLKTQLCQRRGVHLIRIPYTMTSPDTIESYIRKHMPREKTPADP